jgi:hypothetical protein
MLVNLCISDKQIDNIINSFKKVFVEKVRKNPEYYKSNFNLSGTELRDLQSGMWGRNSGEADILNSEGVKSVVSFVRLRKKLHQLNPKTIPAFYFENKLDAKHKIDLIEVIETEKGAILNLIQIKSRQYEYGEIEKYKDAHEDWANGDNTIDLESFEKSFLEEPEDSSVVGEVLGDLDRIHEVFEDILTGSTVFSKEILLDKLGIANRPKTEQMWLLSKYMPKLIETVDSLNLEGIFSEVEFGIVTYFINDVKKQLENVKSQKRDITGVYEIYSICAVKEKEVSKSIIFSGENSKRKSLKIQR